MNTDVQGLPEEYVRLLGALDDAYSRGNWKHETEVIYGQLSAYVRSLIQRQAAELEQSRKDAERYRYLRKCYPNTSPMTVVAYPNRLLAGTACHTEERLDAAVDAQLDPSADCTYDPPALRESQGET